MDRFERHRVYIRAWATGDIMPETDDAYIVAASIGARCFWADGPPCTVDELDAELRRVGVLPEEASDYVPDVGLTDRDERERTEARARLQRLILADGKTDTGGRWLFDAAADEIVRLRNAAAPREETLREAREERETLRRDLNGALARLDFIRATLETPPGESTEACAGRVMREQAELRQARQALEQARAKAQHLRGVLVGAEERRKADEAAIECLKAQRGREAPPVDELSAEDAETLRGKLNEFAKSVTSAAKERGFINNEQMHEIDGIIDRRLWPERYGKDRGPFWTPKAPAAAHGAPGKATGEATAAGTSSLAEGQGAAQGTSQAPGQGAPPHGGDRGQTVAQGAPLCIGCGASRGPAASPHACQPSAQGLPKPARVAVGQRWCVTGPGGVDDLKVERVTERSGATGNDVYLRPSTGTGTSWMTTDLLMLSEPAWTFLGGPAPQDPSPKRDGEPVFVPGPVEAHGDPTPRGAYVVGPVSHGGGCRRVESENGAWFACDRHTKLEADCAIRREAAADASEPTARDAVAGMLLRRAWTNIADDVATEVATTESALRRIRAADLKPEDAAACILALEALARGEIRVVDMGDAVGHAHADLVELRRYMRAALGAGEAESSRAAAKRAVRERDEARAEAAALRGEAKAMADDRDRALGIAKDLAFVAKVSLRDADAAAEMRPSQEPSGMRIEKRAAGEWLVGAGDVNDCEEVPPGTSPDDWSMVCTHHFDGQHISCGKREPCAFKIDARWPIASAAAREDESSRIAIPGADDLHLFSARPDGRVDLIVPKALDPRAALATVAELLGISPDESEGRALSELRRTHHADHQPEPEDLTERWRARWARLEKALEQALVPFERGYLRGLCDAYRCAEVDMAGWLYCRSDAAPPGAPNREQLGRAVHEARGERWAHYETWDELDGSAREDACAIGERLFTMGVDAANANAGDVQYVRHGAVTVAGPHGMTLGEMWEALKASPALRVCLDAELRQARESVRGTTPADMETARRDMRAAVLDDASRVGLEEGERRAKAKAARLAERWERQSNAIMGKAAAEDTICRQVLETDADRLRRCSGLLRNAFGLTDPGKPPTVEPAQDASDAVAPTATSGHVTPGAATDAVLDVVLSHVDIPDERQSDIRLALCELALKDDPMWQAAKRAPVDDEPETAAEAEAMKAGAAGPFIPHAEVTPALATGDSDRTPYHVASKLTPWEARRLAERGFAVHVVWANPVPWYENDAKDLAHLRASASCATPSDAGAAAPVPEKASPVAPDRETLGRETHAAIWAAWADVAPDKNRDVPAWGETYDTEREVMRRTGERLFNMGVMWATGEDDAELAELARLIDDDRLPEAKALLEKVAGRRGAGDAHVVAARWELTMANRRDPDESPTGGDGASWRGPSTPEAPLVRSAHPDAPPPRCPRCKTPMTRQEIAEESGGGIGFRCFRCYPEDDGAPVKPPHNAEGAALGVDLGTGPAETAAHVLERSPSGELRPLATFKGPDAEQLARDFIAGLPLPDAPSPLPETPSTGPAAVTPPRLWVRGSDTWLIGDAEPGCHAESGPRGPERSISLVCIAHLDGHHLATGGCSSGDPGRIVLHRWPIEPASPDPRWEPGAVWECKSVSGNMTRFEIARRDVDGRVWLRTGSETNGLPVSPCEMTEANGWRFVGPAKPAQVKPGQVWRCVGVGNGGLLLLVVSVDGAQVRLEGPGGMPLVTAREESMLGLREWTFVRHGS